jgi:hydroxymethylbilane synthase
MKTYKLGTRGSLLAVTQSTLFKNQLEKLAGINIELVLIKTQGDQITNKPLWQLEGKDFFTKELDEALLKGEVDFVVHSYKDLGSERPDGIKLAAITERKFAHDILLIRADVIPKLKDWTGDFIVGTSSPRRIVNITKNLSRFVPYGKKNNLNIKCETLRGNVNTRIQKLKDGHYHAITLALAGLERLALGEKSKVELEALLKGLNYFILPQSIFPSAASQGALGIEIAENRNDEGKLYSIIHQLSHSLTNEEVSRERTAFKNYGGGCHLAVGIHVKKIWNNQFLHIHAGEIDGKRIEKKWIESSDVQKTKAKNLFVGLPKTQPGILSDEFLAKKILPHQLDLTHKHVFVTSRYCIETLKKSNVASGIWAAGSKTAELLCEEGYWINGTSDSLGTEDLVQFKNSAALALFNEIHQRWSVLTHMTGTSELGEIIGCYDREEKQVSEEWLNRLKTIDACYWTSFPQYQTYIHNFPFLSQAKHFCGLGKTLQEFLKAKVAVHAVASMEEFYGLKEDK